MLLKDARGQAFETANAPQRIVSLVPSWTEALFAFGAGNRVVGVTDYCIHPADGVAAKTKIGGTKNPRVDQILSLAPDLVIANIEENRQADVDALQARGVPVFATFARTVRAAIDELRDIARLVGARNADAVLAPIERTLAAAPVAARRPRVFVAIWREPWMTANGDTYIGDLIETCGGENIFRDRVRRYPLAADLGSAPARETETCDTRYPRVSLEEVGAHKPDIILLPDEPYRFTAHDADELRALPTLRDARIHLIDGTLVSWYGVRTGRAIESISKLLFSEPCEGLEPSQG
jgi:ABC-type Fe3+-hydroxamate transport system substrate-binding protein